MQAIRRKTKLQAHVNLRPPAGVYWDVEQTLRSTPVAAAAEAGVEVDVEIDAEVDMEELGGGVREEVRDFDAVVRACRPRIFRFILASVRDRDAAETLTQDCFLKAYRARRRFRGEASVQTWLMRIAINLVRDFGRNRRLQFWRRASASAVSPSDLKEWLPARNASPEAATLAGERVAAVWNAVTELPERQRTVFLLRFVEDMSLLEIAAATRLSEGAVKVHLFRAVHKIRKKVGGLR